jgi:hypothetical protein
MVRSSSGYLRRRVPVNLAHNWSTWGSAPGDIGASIQGIPSSRLFARGLAVPCGLLAVMGLIPGFNIWFGLVPLSGHEV